MIDYSFCPQCKNVIRTPLYTSHASAIVAYKARIPITTDVQSSLRKILTPPSTSKPKKVLQIQLPAPVAPAHGTAASTTATDRSDSVRNWRAMDRPIIPAPTTTTSNVWDDDTLISFKRREGAVSSDRSVWALASNGFPKNLLPNKHEEVDGLR